MGSVSKREKKLGEYHRAHCWDNQVSDLLQLDADVNIAELVLQFRPIFESISGGKVEFDCRVGVVQNNQHSVQFIPSQIGQYAVPGINGLVGAGA